MPEMLCPPGEAGGSYDRVDHELPHIKRVTIVLTSGDECPRGLKVGGLAACQCRWSARNRRIERENGPVDHTDETVGNRFVGMTCQTRCERGNGVLVTQGRQGRDLLVSRVTAPPAGGN